jgi:glycosyltransferase involved in cell wall biosynthesis
MQFGRGYSFGTERYVSMLCEGLRRRGHEVAVLAGDPERRGAPAALGQRVADDPPLLAYPSYGWMAVEGVAPAELALLLDRERPDVVHLANPGHIGLGLIHAARGRRIPIVVTILDYWWLCPKHTLRHFQRGVCDARVTWRECLACIAADRPRSLRRGIAHLPLLRDALLPPLFFTRWRLDGVPARERAAWRRRQGLTLAALRSADAVIFPSRAAEELLRPRLSGGAPGEAPRCFSIPYGLEPRWFEARRSTEPSRGAGVVVGYAGALVPHKGAHTLLEALRLLSWRDSEARIAGAGPAEYARQLQANEPTTPIRFVGSIASAEMPRYLSELDVFVLPSLWPENLPIAALEALAVGVPVLASRIPGVQELVPAERQFEPGSPADLAACLRRWRESGDRTVGDVIVGTCEEMLDGVLSVYSAVGRV